MEKPSIMSSSAEVDSFRFLLGGRGRDEEGCRSASRSESEERRNIEPLMWLLFITFDLFSRSLSDLDFLFFRWPLDWGPSTSFMVNIQNNQPPWRTLSLEWKASKAEFPQYPWKCCQSLRSEVNGLYPRDNTFWRKFQTAAGHSIKLGSTWGSPKAVHQIHHAITKPPIPSEDCFFKLKQMSVQWTYPSIVRLAGASTFFFSDWPPAQDRKLTPEIIKTEIVRGRACIYNIFTKQRSTMHSIKKWLLYRCSMLP